MGGGPPCFPQGFSCLVVLWSRICGLLPSPTGLSPSMGNLSRFLRLQYLRFIILSTTPKDKSFGLGSFPFARRYLENRVFFLFLRVLRCFSSPGLPPLCYVFTQRYLNITPGGFPHSDISGSMLVCSSPELFAACHVLLRLPVPRHPPYALISLTS